MSGSGRSDNNYIINVVVGFEKFPGVVIDDSGFRVAHRIFVQFSHYDVISRKVGDCRVYIDTVGIYLVEFRTSRAASPSPPPYDQDVSRAWAADNAVIPKDS